MFLEKEEIKFAVVYTIWQFRAPISMSRIYEILTWDKEVMEYFELSEALMELSEDGYIIEKYYRNEESFSLSEKGEDAYLYFKSRIPASIKQRIDSAIGEIKYTELIDPNAVRAEVVLAAREQYMARCCILDGKVPMLELSINMGTKPQAENAAEIFKEKADEIYKQILKLFIPEINEK